MRNTLEEEVIEYLNSLPNFKAKDKVSWNEGGELYTISFRDGTEKSLFATSLEKRQDKLRDIFKTFFEECKNRSDIFVQCEEIFIKDIIEHKQVQGCYIFVIMEKITPLIELVLDEKYVEHNCGPNVKKIKLLSDVIQIGNIIKKVSTHYPSINMFINNEEICVDESNNARLLLFDMIKNEIATNNQVYELEHFLKYIASGMGISLKITLEEMSIEELIVKCTNEREKLLKIEKDSEEKITKYLHAAEKGDSRACTNLGYMYEKGRGTPIDYKKAMFWYEKAAECKYAPALNNLAHMYQKGYGVEKDYTKAVAYLLQAAKLKDAVAQLNLGMAYQKGKGIGKDNKKAIFWYKKSAKNGNSMAQILYDKIKLNKNTGRK